jgi:hypothetical protein
MTIDHQPRRLRDGPARSDRERGRGHRLACGSSHDAFVDRIGALEDPVDQPTARRRHPELLPQDVGLGDDTDQLTVGLADRDAGDPMPGKERGYVLQGCARTHRDNVTTHQLLDSHVPIVPRPAHPSIRLLADLECGQLRRAGRASSDATAHGGTQHRGRLPRGS